jgi:Na+/H+ antiporter NhaC
MSSAGAQCGHMNHVTTQVPYALTVAAVAFIFFLIAGFWQSFLVTIIGIIFMIATLIVMKKLQEKDKLIFDRRYR